MTDSNYSSAEINIDPEYGDYLADQAEQAQDEYERDRDFREKSQSTLQQQDRVSKEVQDDPRNADNWGAKALIKEGQSILSGGLQDTASSLATFQNVHSMRCLAKCKEKGKKLVHIDQNGVHLERMTIQSKQKHGGVSSFVA